MPYFRYFLQTVDAKNENLSFFTHIHVISNPYTDFFSPVAHDRRTFKEFFTQFFSTQSCKIIFSISLTVGCNISCACSFLQPF